MHSLHQYLKAFDSLSFAKKLAQNKGIIDPYFFDPENMNLRKWYIVGYIISDGHVSGNTLFITSTEKDKSNLYDMHDYMQIDTEIFVREKYTKSKNSTSKTIEYTIYKNCREWIEALELYGIIPNKTSTTIIPYEFIINCEIASAICRGIFDGDGCVSYSQSKDGQYRTLFSVVGSKNLLEDYSFILEHCCDIKPKVHKKKNKNCFEISVSGVKCKRIYDFLYGYENFYIKRKKERFEQLINGTFTKENDPYYVN